MILSNLLLAIVSFILISFILSRILKRNDIADVMWGPGFLLVALLQMNNELSFKSKLILTLLAVWGLRLMIHILVRFIKKDEDQRYQNWRSDWGKREPIYAFLKVFTLQGAVLGVVSLPISISIGQNVEAILWHDFLAILLFIIGFIVESISDWELSIFKRKGSNGPLQEGLWSHCRHPNYLGEILIWWGFFFFNPTLLTFASPLMITFLLIKVSGAPMLDKILESKGKDFQEYIKSTRSFIPFSFSDFVIFLRVTVIVVILDYLWLGVLLKDFYITEAKRIAYISNGSFSPIVWGALFVYIFIPFGLIWINRKPKTLPQSIFNGAIFGLILYSVYDFTNIALIKGWPLKMSLIDILWGPILCGLASIASFRFKTESSSPIPKSSSS